MNKILFIVDAQNDFMPGGALAVPNGDEIIPRVNELIRDKDTMFVYYSRDFHPEDHISFAKNCGVEPFTMKDGEMKYPPHCIGGTIGADINKLITVPLQSANFEFVYEICKGMEKTKEQYSALQDRIETEGFVDIVKQYSIDEIVFVGLSLEFCVKATVMDALNILKDIDGVKVVVDLKGIRGIYKDQCEEAIKTMKYAGAEIRE